MLIYVGTLTLHENLFYATREVGRLYETGRYLHNYALTYALGLAVAPYFHAEQRPHYREQLEPLNERGIYVTPARGVSITYALNTFKYANNNYHVKMIPGRTNTPTFGRAKEIAVGSTFQFAILSVKESLRLPSWIRMGLWGSKIKVEWDSGEAKYHANKQNKTSFPLNPLDVSGSFSAFDLISMPPSSLIDHALLKTDWWQAKMDKIGTIHLPARMAYTFPEGVS